MKIRHPMATRGFGRSAGDSLDGERIVFTYGYASGQPIPPGASRVSITLAAGCKGHGAEPDACFRRGRRARSARAGLEIPAFAIRQRGGGRGSLPMPRQWWMAGMRRGRSPMPRSGTRRWRKWPRRTIRFRDRFSLLDGAEDLSAHIAAAQRFMPGISLRRKGSVRHCQGTALAEWVAVSADGVERMSGTSVFRLRAQTDGLNRRQESPTHRASERSRNSPRKAQFHEKLNSRRRAIIEKHVGCLASKTARNRRALTRTATPSCAIHPGKKERPMTGTIVNDLSGLFQISSFG